MKKLSHIISGIIILLSIVSQSFASSTGDVIDNSKTIKEIKETLKNLNENQQELSIESKILNKDEKLKTFFINGITQDQINDIESIIINYNAKRNYLNKVLLEKAKLLDDTSNEKALLLEAKKDLYKKLTPYIDREFLSDYLLYIKEDAKILKEKKDVTEQIIVHKEILSDRVTMIEQRIKEHRSVLSDQIKTAVTIKIDEKIAQLENNLKFKDLSGSLKVQVLDKTIRRVKIKVHNIENSDNISELLSKKLEIYKILIEKLHLYQERLKNTH